VRKTDIMIEIRLKEIEDFMKKDNNRNSQTKLLYGDSRKYYWKRDELVKEKNPLKNKSVQRIIDELKNEF
jgi:hypothetical protein